MTNQPKIFPLNFDAPMWSVEEAVPWIFFGDSSEHSLWSEVTRIAVGYVVGEVDDRELSKSQSEAYANLQRHIRMLGDLSRSTSFPPVVWCRLAVQFWLKHGGRQKVFTSAMTRWVIVMNRGGIAFVSYVSGDNKNGREMPLEAFLLDNIEESELLKNNWSYRHQSGKSNQQTKTESTGGRSDESQVGSKLLSAVKVAVQKLFDDKRGGKLFLRKPDPATGKFRFIGLREELYEEIHGISPNFRGKRLLNNGRYQKGYAKGVVIKAISKVAICRRSWA